MKKIRLLLGALTMIPHIVIFLLCKYNLMSRGGFLKTFTDGKQLRELKGTICLLS